MKNVLKYGLLVGVQLVGLALLIAACGGGGVTTGGVKEIKVENTEFKFSPADVTVKAGEKVKLTLTNKGAVDHTWVLLAADGKTESVKLEVKVGGTVSKEFTAPATGAYTVICDIAGHKEGGMVGKLIVQ